MIHPSRLSPEAYLEHFRDRDGLAKLFQVRWISINKTECICEYDVKPEHFNPHGILHGGVLFSVMDSGQGAFVHFVLDESYQAAATGTATVKYLAPVRSGTIRVHTTLKETQGRKIFVSSDAVNDEGRTVATLEEIWIAFNPKA